jgi:hypothetical protein
LASQGAGKNKKDDDLKKIVKETSKLAIELTYGLMTEVLKDHVFTKSAN